MKKKVLIVNQNSGYLTIDVANSFLSQYDEVVVMFGINKVTERPFHPNIKFQKTIAYNRSSTFSRLLTWVSCTVHLFLLIAFKYRKFSILYYTNPPMSYFCSLFFSNPFSIVVFDTYPDALKVIGIKSTTLVYKYWVLVNKKVFSKAEKIVTLSNGMKRQLLTYVSEDKIEVVSIWPASNKFKPIKKGDNSFLVINGWEEKFIILYSGNMGLGHQLEILIDVAEKLKSHEKILFLFIGEGSKKQNLQNLVIAKELTNVHFLTWQKPENMSFSLASADLAVVSVEPDATNASVPSKTYNCMAVGAPLLCIGSRGSELENLVQTNGNGRFFTNQEVIEITRFVEEMSENTILKELYSKNSFNAAQRITFALADNYLF